MTQNHRSAFSRVFHIIQRWKCIPSTTKMALYTSPEPTRRVTARKIWLRLWMLCVVRRGSFEEGWMKRSVLLLVIIKDYVGAFDRMTLRRKKAKMDKTHCFTCFKMRLHLRWSTTIFSQLPHMRTTISPDFWITYIPMNRSTCIRTLKKAKKSC